jgi:hypothetical protein
MELPSQSGSVAEPELSIALRLTRVPTQHLVPNLMIVGPSHCGAPTLARDLAGHPDVQACLARVDRYTPLRFGRPVESGIEDYNGHFSRWNGQAYRLETASTYFDGGPELIGALVRELPGLRVLVVLRDPVPRLWASYSDKIRRARLSRAVSYETFVERCVALRENGADGFEGNRHFRTFGAGFYIEHLPGWLGAFGGRARVLFTQDLVAARAATHTGVLDWLGLDPAMRGEQEAPEPDPDGEESWPGEAAEAQLDSVVQPGAGLGRRRGPKFAATEVPAQNDRTRSRVSELYADANRSLAGYLRGHGVGHLPPWLARA